jgi:hypothetical protein
MDSFLTRFKDKIKGVISGFDRIVFKGCLRQLMFPDGAMSFLRNRGVLNKDYKDWAMTQSALICEAANALSLAECGHPATPISSCHERKEAIAHARQKELGIKTGLIGVWSCVEACSTFRAHFDREKKFPQLRHEFSRCKHLYFYLDHADYGFLSIRLQTWFPFGIQIALNGREWLRRSLDKRSIGYTLHGNKFLHLADFTKAQELLDTQVDTRWAKLLCGFLPLAFPAMKQVLGSNLSYYWTLWQSEWATDYLFHSPAELTSIMDNMLHHAMCTGTCDRILKYMGRPVDANGQPHHRADPEVITRASRWHEGARIRHWVDGNSVKLYNEHNVLRPEVTINNPGMFRACRQPEGKDGPKKRLPLRKGIADIALRTEFSAEVSHRFMEQMATLHDDTPVHKMLQPVTRSSVQSGRQVRALDVMGKDLELLQAIADPQYSVSGLNNKSLRMKLGHSPWAKGLTGRQLSARLSRQLRLLRDHGIIRKMPKQRRYLLTARGQALTTALNAMLNASTQQLMEKAA